MTSVAALYNTLPTFEEADEKFSNREEVLSKLGPLFAKYDCKFGVVLVHRHCKLEEGEMMVATGGTSQPEKDVQCHPEKWLATGEAYEFNKEPTAHPPEDLFKEFQKITQSVGVLGISFIREEDSSVGVPIERTEGRTNITEMYGPDEPVPYDTKTSCWKSDSLGNTYLSTGCRQQNGTHRLTSIPP